MRQITLMLPFLLIGFLSSSPLWAHEAKTHSFRSAQEFVSHIKSHEQDIKRKSVKENPQQAVEKQGAPRGHLYQTVPVNR